MYTNLLYDKTSITDNRVDEISEKPLPSRKSLLAASRRHREKVYPDFNSERRSDWDRNHLAVKNAIRHFIRQGRERFSGADIAWHCHLSECTVKKHIRELDVDEIYYRERVRNRKATDRVITIIAMGGLSGNINLMINALRVIYLWEHPDYQFKTKWERREIGSLQRYIRRKDAEANDKRKLDMMRIFE